jgi:crotonobetainyl-CoA:carnitine CoA-transferase CaiB-like acyl-CoA transferase
MTALNGIRVLDLTVFQQGPAATVALADMGADVIKIEEPILGDPARAIVFSSDGELPINVYFETHNRNKKGITLNLRKERGLEVLYRLVEKSDVFVHNLRPGVPERRRVDYETLAGINRRLIYASASGWGSKGLDAQKPAFDNLVQARAGTGYLIGEEGDPPMFVKTVGLGDWVGAVSLLYGIMLALFDRERTGMGQEVEASLLGGQIWFAQLGLQRYLFSGQIPERLGLRQLGTQAADGKWLTSAAATDRMWANYCKALGAEELTDDPRFSTMLARQENWQELRAIVEAIYITKPRAEWLKRLEEFDVPCSPIQDYAELAKDPQVLANEHIVDLEHPVMGPVKVVGLPTKLSRTPGKIRTAAPTLGEHTEEILSQIGGYTAQEIADFKMEEVI